MSKKLLIKLFSFITAFLCCFWGCASAYKEEAVQRAIETAKLRYINWYMFCEYLWMPPILSNGVHRAEMYCKLLNCTMDELIKEKFLNGHVFPDGTVDSEMRTDFMLLADKVREKLR